MKNYTNQEINEIKRKLKKEFSYWYHKIDLGYGITTPGFDYDTLWDNIRRVRKKINYKNKTVLDIASFDGMWAFEAEVSEQRILLPQIVYIDRLKIFFSVEKF